MHPRYMVLTGLVVIVTKSWRVLLTRQLKPGTSIRLILKENLSPNHAYGPTILFGGRGICLSEKVFWAFRNEVKRLWRCMEKMKILLSLSRAIRMWWKSSFGGKAITVFTLSTFCHRHFWSTPQEIFNWSLGQKTVLSDSGLLIQRLCTYALIIISACILLISMIFLESWSPTWNSARPI